MKTIIKMLLSAAISMAAGVGAIALNLSDNVVVVTAICAAIIAAGAMGVFNERKSERSMRSGFKFNVSGFKKAA